MIRRRIAMISEHASPLATLGGADGGGQNVYVGQLARHLGAFGYDVDIFTRRDRDDLPEVVFWDDHARIVHVPAGPPRAVPKEELLPFMGQFTRRVLERCREGAGYGLIHAHFFMSALVAAEVKRTLGLPFVVTFHALGRVRRLHQGGADTFPEERAEIEQRVVREADVVIAECPQDESDLIEHYDARPGHLATIPCGFDRDEFWPVGKDQARAALGLDPRERIVLQLGRMVPRKGVDNVIRGLARLRHGRGVEARLLVVGGESETPDPSRTPEIGRLMQIAAEERVADAVTFVGSRPRQVLRNYFSAADVFVTTPWYEPFGITPVEAMACGTPVVGSNVGGIRTTVADGWSGYLVPPRDPEALADRLGRLLGDPATLERFGRRAAERANALFTWEKVAAAVSRVYEQVVRGEPESDRAVRNARRGSGRQRVALVRYRSRLGPEEGGDSL